MERSKTRKELVIGLAKDASIITMLSEMYAICATSVILRVIRCSTISNNRD
jgi:hypothetical protein